MTCNQCDGLCITVAIRTPGELRKAIEVVGDNLRDGTIEEVALNDLTIGALPPFANVLAGAQWSDLMAYRFRCTTCGELFSLTAETYHGSGGAWRPEREEAGREVF